MRTEFLNAPGLGASSIAGRGIAQSREPSEARFQHALSVASLQKSPENEASGDVASTHSGSRDSNTPCIIEVSPQSPVRPALTDTHRGRPNPFGPDAGQNVGLDKEAEWIDYFRTHAPGEWSANAAARAKFAETYSAAALVTLDWTGTVPENIDSTWVTRCAVDPSGKPLPRVPSTELT